MALIYRQCTIAKLFYLCITCKYFIIRGNVPLHKEYNWRENTYVLTDWLMEKKIMEKFIRDKEVKGKENAIWTRYLQWKY